MSIFLPKADLILFKIVMIYVTGLTQLSQNSGWCVTQKPYSFIKYQTKCHSTLQEKYASCVSPM